ncbi:MAG TPA: SPOR domain-containing protein [Gemmatimonadales bacterium]|nr:SPOR domain-containing protein [Gemmatimonadales bacterium]
MTGHLSAALASVLVAIAAGPAALPAQSDARVLAAVRLAQDGRIDSARASLAALEKSVSPADSAFAQVLYAQGLVAPTVDDARQRLQRVVSEYPLSTWADDAVVRLAQLEYANGDPAAAARQLEKFHGDYAASPLFPTAAVWAGRSLLRAKDSLAGCRWVSEGLGRVGQDAATRRELAKLATACGSKVVAVRDTVKPAVVQADTALPKAVTPVATAPVTVPPPAAPTVAKPESTPPPARMPAWRVQVIAAKTPAEADAQLLRAKRAGFDAIVVREGDFHKVRVGSYASRADAVAAATRVKATLGGQPFVVRDP